MVELTGAEVQAVGRSVVAELFAVDQLAGVAAVQLAVGFVFVFNFAAQFVEGAGQFAGRVVLITAVDRVVGVLDQQTGVNAGVVHPGQFVGRQVGGELPSLAAHGVVAKTTGELALGAIDLAVQVVAFHVTDQLAVEVQLVQVAAAVVQVIQVLACRQRQCGQVAERIVFVGQGALGRRLFDQAAQEVVFEVECFFADAKSLAD